MANMTRARFSELAKPFFAPNPDPDREDRARVREVMHRAIVDANQNFAMKSAAWKPGQPTPSYESDREIEDAAFIMYCSRYWFTMSPRDGFGEFLEGLLSK
jgi:hypothetical protein